MANSKNSTIGKFRKALTGAGFFWRWSPTIYNDSGCRGVRRLKLWEGDQVFNASQMQQRNLEWRLREAFGDDILAMYFINQRDWLMNDPGKSLCIKLKM